MPNSLPNVPNGEFCNFDGNKGNSLFGTMSVCSADNILIQILLDCFEKHNEVLDPLYLLKKFLIEFQNGISSNQKGKKSHQSFFRNSYKLH